MILSPLQTKALRVMGVGVPLNLRLSYTRPTIDSLIRRGLVVETPDLENRREYSITSAGIEYLNTHGEMPQ